MVSSGLSLAKSDRSYGFESEAVQERATTSRAAVPEIRREERIPVLRRYVPPAPYCDCFSLGDRSRFRPRFPAKASTLQNNGRDLIHCDPRGFEHSGALGAIAHAQLLTRQKRVITLAINGHYSIRRLEP